MLHLLQKTWASQEERVRQKGPRSRACSFHSPTCSSFHKWRNGKRGNQWLADMITQKRQNRYSMVMGWLRRRVSFASLRSPIMCICFIRSAFHRPINNSDILLVTTEGCVPFYTNWLSFCLHSFTAMQCSSPSCTLKLTLRVLVLDDIISSNLGVAHSHYI